MYLIRKRHPERTKRDHISPYHGAVAVLSNRAWFVTGLHGPDLYETEDAAWDVIHKLDNPDGYVYDVIRADEYSNSLDEDTLRRVDWALDLLLHPSVLKATTVEVSHQAEE